MFNSKIQYSIAFLRLCKRNGVEPTTIKSFCSVYRLQKPMAEQITAKLRQQGLIEAIKGPGGGYVLARRYIKLSELIRLWEVDQSRYSSSHAYFKQNVKFIEGLALGQYAKINVLEDNTDSVNSF